MFKSTIALSVLAVSIASVARAEMLTLPQGKGKCPTFKFEGEKGWRLKSDRAAGDRWVLENAAGIRIARFDYKLSSTDQKQLPEVESKKIKLGAFGVEKFTVTTDPSAGGEKATEGLITSYSYEEGRLTGLKVMTPEYNSDSGLDRIIEKALGTIK